MYNQNSLLLWRHDTDVTPVGRRTLAGKNKLTDVTINQLSTYYIKSHKKSPSAPVINMEKTVIASFRVFSIKTNPTSWTWPSGCGLVALLPSRSC